MNWDCHLLADGGKRCEHEQSKSIGIVTYHLRVESGVSMSNHSELDCHLQTERGVSMSSHSELRLSLTR